MTDTPTPTTPDRYGDPLDPANRTKRVFALAPTYEAIWKAVAPKVKWQCPCGYKAHNYRMISHHDLDCPVRAEFKRQLEVAREVVEHPERIAS